ncbi:YeiH family protein [Pedobacter arcticus]|uniref:YeiH family protein n=1 Tax=Pedobacter arcticus TaxID=752140 RepID=UPI0002F66AE6|nr:putative sulfate exporter family transporter [Pedobacter arcticus]
MEHTHSISAYFSKEKIIYIICALLCLTPWVSPLVALLGGIILVQFFDHPFKKQSHTTVAFLLQFAVVGLGFGMNLTMAIQSGKSGFIYTVASIFGTIFLGLLFGKILKTEKKTSFLISAGTAICGGSAIAALAPVLRTKEKETSIALGIIFILNAVALFVFPVVGHYFNLSQSQFGLWCAIAIHDTSSVVGAANKYGAEALQVATTVKLMRALWIIPIALASAFIFKNPSKKIKIPYFIGLFLLAMLASTFFEPVKMIAPYIVAISKLALTLTLFLIGTGLSKAVLKSVGFKPLLQGLVLWVLVSGAALYVIYNFS